MPAAQECFTVNPGLGASAFCCRAAAVTPQAQGRPPVEQPVPLFREAANPVHTWDRGSQEAPFPLATPL